MQPANACDGPFLDVCFRAAVENTNAINLRDLVRRTGAIELNRKDSLYGLTALMWAAALGNFSLCRLLLGHPQINLTATDHFGDTALHYAARNGHSNIVALLLTYPEALGILRNHAGATAYDLAKMRDHKAAGSFLGRDRIIQTRIMRYFTTQAKNNDNAPTGWPFVPHEIAERFLAYRAEPIGSDYRKISKIIELCKKDAP